MTLRSKRDDSGGWDDEAWQGTITLNAQEAPRARR